MISEYGTLRNISLFLSRLAAPLSSFSGTYRASPRAYDYYGSNWGAAMFGLESKDFLL
jgi:hypothetical protein